MTRLARLTAYLTSTVAVFAWSHAAIGADLLLTPVPMEEADVPMAVSGVNGKWELDVGALNATGAIRAAGSLSIPVGTQFGLQGDVMFTNSGAYGPVWGGAIHAFTRDPESYLLGVTAGVVVSPDARLSAIGIEGELYMDRISLEGWGGLAAVDYAVNPPPDMTGLFGFGDIAYYPTDDWRVVFGGSYILGETKLHLGTEYQFTDLGMPLSLTADARVGAANSSVMVGLKGYFGGDPGKSLIDRHRQDDPPNRALSLYFAAAGLLAPPPIITGDPETSQETCEAYGWTWDDEDYYPCNIDPLASSSEEACNWVNDNYYDNVYWTGTECLYDD
ncbi:MAG TPA: hypothetical protein VG757_15540 [Devosia sp.]|nr:hypothetical protein [Devosia sp.]